MGGLNTKGMLTVAVITVVVMAIVARVSALQSIVGG